MLAWEVEPNAMISIVRYKWGQIPVRFYAYTFVVCIWLCIVYAGNGADCVCIYVCGGAGEWACSFTFPAKHSTPRGEGGMSRENSSISSCKVPASEGCFHDDGEPGSTCGMLHAKEVRLASNVHPRGGHNQVAHCLGGIELNSPNNYECATDWWHLRSACSLHLSLWVPTCAMSHSENLDRWCNRHICKWVSIIIYKIKIEYEYTSPYLVDANIYTK